MSDKKALTDKTLEAAQKHRGSTYELADAAAKGLRVRVTPTGRVLFRWVYREVSEDGKPKQKIANLGEYPITTLAEARVALEKAKRDLDKRRKRPKKARAKPQTVSALIEEFREAYLTRNKDGGAEAHWALKRYVEPALGDMRLVDVEQADVSDMILVVAKKAPVYSRKVLNLTRRMFAYALSRRYVKASPAAGVEAEFHDVKPHTPRKRWLKADEIKAVYAALDASPRMSDQVKAGLKILLLTGVRRGQLVKAEWRHLDLEAATWTIPPSLQKLSPAKAREADDFLIPLSWQAVALFKQLKALSGLSGYVMGSQGAEDQPERRMEPGTMTQAVERMFKRKVNGEPFMKIEKFVVHDLRRTCRSHLTESLNVDEQLAEKVLDHKSALLIKTYDRGERFKQRQEVMQRWADFVDHAVNGGNVVELRHG